MKLLFIDKKKKKRVTWIMSLLYFSHLVDAVLVC
jgi:hypothetical protein